MFCGNGTNNIDNCYNEGTITGAYAIGGIIGQIKENDATTVTCCYNNGLINGNSSTPVVRVSARDGIDDKNRIHIGGIAGVTFVRASATIDYCYNLNNINSDNKKLYVGGIAGNLKGASNKKIGTMNHCYNSGNVSSRGKYIGGLLGEQTSYTFVKNSFSSESATVTCNGTPAVEKSATEDPHVGLLFGTSGGTTNIGSGDDYNDTKPSNEMPSVYDVLNELGTGNASTIWTNETYPKLLWEENNN